MAVPKPHPHRVIRAPVPWNAAYQESRDTCKGSLFVTNPLMHLLQNLWFERWALSAWFVIRLAAGRVKEGTLLSISTSSLLSQVPLPEVRWRVRHLGVRPSASSYQLRGAGELVIFSLAKLFEEFNRKPFVKLNESELLNASLLMLLLSFPCKRLLNTKQQNEKWRKTL